MFAIQSIIVYTINRLGLKNEKTIFEEDGKMITIQYIPKGEFFRVTTQSGTRYLSLQRLRKLAESFGTEYDWQVVIDNPQQKFFL